MQLPFGYSSVIYQRIGCGNNWCWILSTLDGLINFLGHFVSPSYITASIGSELVALGYLFMLQAVCLLLEEHFLFWKKLSLTPL